jgi:16S rRNA C1402 (ribose-2'-O) methylase RsmI
MGALENYGGFMDSSVQNQKFIFNGFLKISHVSKFCQDLP